MPRRRAEDIDWALWAQTLKPWMRETLKILVEAQRPLTTGEILEQLADRLPDQEWQMLVEGKTSGYHKLLRFLKRLQAHGIARRSRIGYYYRYAWKLALPDKEKTRIKQALEEA